MFEYWSVFRHAERLSLREASKQLAQYKASQKQIDDEVAEIIDIEATEIIEARNNELEQRPS